MRWWPRTTGKPEDKLRRHLSKVVDTFFVVPYLNRLTMRMIRESVEAQAQRIADCYLTPIYHAYEQLIGEGVAVGSLPADRSANVLFYRDRRCGPLLFGTACRYVIVLARMH